MGESVVCGMVICYPTHAQSARIYGALSLYRNSACVVPPFSKCEGPGALGNDLSSSGIPSPKCQQSSPIIGGEI